jgi:hypothetical protein
MREAHVRPRLVSCSGSRPSSDDGTARGRGALVNTAASQRHNAEVALRRRPVHRQTSGSASTAASSRRVPAEDSGMVLAVQSQRLVGGRPRAALEQNAGGTVESPLGGNGHSNPRFEALRQRVRARESQARHSSQ